MPSSTVAAAQKRVRQRAATIATPRAWKVRTIVAGAIRILIEFEDPAEAKAAVAELRKQGVRIDHRTMGTSSLWETTPEFAPEVRELLKDSVLPAGISLRLQELALREQRRRAA